MDDILISKDEYIEFKGISSLTDRDKLAYIQNFLEASIQKYIDELKGVTRAYRYHIVGVISTLQNLNRQFFVENKQEKS